MSGPFKMKGFGGFGNESPLKQGIRARKQFEQFHPKTSKFMDITFC